MELFYEEEKEQLSELERYMLSKCNTKLEKWAMYEDFLLRAETDEEMFEQLNKYSSTDITTAWVGLYSKYFAKIKYPKNANRIYDFEFVGYTKQNLLQLTKGQEMILMTNKMGIKFSKTSWSKFIKNFNLDEITRVRLYQLYSSHSREDDNFLNQIKDLKISYTPFETMEPFEWIKRYPQISI
jgi:hypothetical protein